jgi:tRNA threonylcarbamoyladenosine biosynthesis protein TsaB
MRILALDTALAATSVAILRDDVVLASRSEAMTRGHQERLATLVQELMRQAGLDFTDLERIAVTVGPGSFTGLRVGLAFAKGLGAALQRPVTGVGTLEALAASAPPARLTAAVIDARRDQIYVQAFADGAPASPPEALGLDQATARLLALDPEGPSHLIGPGAALLAERFPLAACDPRSAPDPAALARLAADAASSGPPAPLYLRAPDAKLPA